MTLAHALPAAAPDRFWRNPGTWMAAIAAGLMFLNTARALTDPVGFSAYLGLPLAEGASAGFVQVYALRALFLGLFAGALLLTRQRRALSLFALVAVVMPVGDALLTAQAGAPPGTVARHGAIALFLLATGLLLRRGAGRG